MPANKYGVDIAELYRTTAAVKGARTQNKMAALNLSEAERVVAERPEKERLAAERKNMLSGLRQKTVEGDQDASRQLLALDPEGGAAFVDAVAKMDDRQKTAMQEQLDITGRMTASILQSPPEKRPAMYAQMLSTLPEESKAKMPETYDENFLNMSLAKQRTMDKILETKSVSFGGQDILTKGGMEVERAAKPVKGGGAGGVKSADESLMYKMSAELLGGIFDQEGNLTVLDPEGRNKAQAIATEASNLFARHKGKLTRAEAVRRAANKFDLSIVSPVENPADPGTIDKYFFPK